MSRINECRAEEKKEEIMEIENENYRKFLLKNKEIIDNEPKSDAGLRMQYYAKVLLDLTDKVFHTENGFSQPFDDFGEFWVFYDSAFSKYSKQYADLEEKYSYTGEVTYDVEKLERMVRECLEEVIQLRPNDSDQDKTCLLYYGGRLFELYRNMVYYYFDVIVKI